MMTKKKQIDVLTRTLGDYRKENRLLKREKQQLIEELNEARKNAIFWQKQTMRLMETHPTVVELRALFAADAAPVPKKKEKSRLFTME